MADKQFLRLSERWALGYDNLQWIIQRRGSFDKKQGALRWQPLSFISSSRDILILTLREKGAVVDPEKMGEVLALPDTFQEWIGQRQNRGTAGRQSGGLDIAAKKPRDGGMKGALARSRGFPASGSSRVSAAPISAFGEKVLIPRDLIAATLPKQPYQPEDGEDLLAISSSLDHKAAVPLNHPLRRRKTHAKAA